LIPELFYGSPAVKGEKAAVQIIDARRLSDDKKSLAGFKGFGCAASGTNESMMPDENFMLSVGTFLRQVCFQDQPLFFFCGSPAMILPSHY